VLRTPGQEYTAECDDTTSPECEHTTKVSAINDATALYLLGRKGWLTTVVYGAEIRNELTCPSCALRRND
jgi:hypothetical protein